MKRVFDPFHDKVLNDYEPQNDHQKAALATVGDYIDHLEEGRTHGKGLTFLGPNGVGKTMLANLVIKEAMLHGYRIEAIELSSYVGLHKRRFSLQGLMKFGDDDLVDEYVRNDHQIRSIQGILKKSADWVLFDDVGREYEADSGWSEGEFFDTLRTRWNRGLPSLVTTNLPLRELDQRYGEGLPSLLMEATEVVVVDGDDYRWKKDN